MAFRGGFFVDETPVKSEGLAPVPNRVSLVDVDSSFNQRADFKGNDTTCAQKKVSENYVAMLYEICAKLGPQVTPLFEFKPKVGCPLSVTLYLGTREFSKIEKFQSKKEAKNAVAKVGLHYALKLVTENNEENVLWSRYLNDFFGNEKQVPIIAKFENHEIGGFSCVLEIGGVEFGDPAHLCRSKQLAKNYASRIAIEQFFPSDFVEKVVHGGGNANGEAEGIVNEPQKHSEQDENSGEKQAFSMPLSSASFEARHSSNSLLPLKTHAKSEHEKADVQYVNKEQVHVKQEPVDIGQGQINVRGSDTKSTGNFRMLYGTAIKNLCQQLRLPQPQFQYSPAKGKPVGWFDAEATIWNTTISVKNVLHKTSARDFLNEKALQYLIAVEPRRRKELEAIDRIIRRDR
ncbi:hypothetical protein V1512DRAFT_248155 [Lipomyces arxii]|uniref:uncharacterized protein n=1 Tax=Lipomyces arxii TaxID=56418 RepID=UPI0034CE27AB